MNMRTGVPVSPGISIAQVMVLSAQDDFIPHRHIAPTHQDAEVKRIHQAFDEAILELAELEAQHYELGQLEISDLFAVHRHLLQDPSLRNKVINLIQSQSLSAESAVGHVLGEFRRHFAQIQDKYISERGADILDIQRRLLRFLTHDKLSDLSHLDHEVIVVARDLSPTQTADFDPQFVKGIACDTGGETSHASIVARALGIPAVVGLEDISDQLQDDDLIIIDGNSGTVIIEPTSDTVADYQEAAAMIQSFQLKLAAVCREPAITLDGTRINLWANIEFPREAQKALDTGAEGIGLFRTEFLYLQSQTEPTEEHHFEAYAQVVAAMQGRPVTIRTMDLGADKFTQSHRFRPETNPFLGLRSIRFSLKHQDMFTAQLRAILRASALGPIKVMFPLITHLKEFQKAYDILQTVKAQLDEKGIVYDRDIPVGIMIEVPSAALTAASLAKHAAFFSIGTNDLTQYTLAVDRGNADVAPLFSSAEPAVLQLIQTTLAGAAQTGIDVSICGKMAGDPKYTMLLLGLGVRTLSMPPTMLGEVKRIIRAVNLSDCETLAQTVMSLETEEAVTQLLLNKKPAPSPDLLN